MKAIVLCADDYGQAPAISEGILALLDARRLSATSCMVNTSYWPVYADKLVQYQERADIGLHFNLTHGQALSRAGKFDSLSTLIIKAHTFRIDKEAIALELNAQIDAFQQATGMLPRFLDGHQHVHHLPMIREVVVDVFNERLKGSGSYMRLVAMPLSVTEVFSKKMVIYLTGVRRFKQLLLKHGISHNSSFSGIYDFANAVRYAEYFPGFLREVGDGGLIMCHPGMAPGDKGDEIGAGRGFEYTYFRSDRFLQDCVDANVIVGKRRPAACPRDLYKV
jgi:predicted glycoside hydrolase/deacetylase ChbG (UPF0249 family)